MTSGNFLDKFKADIDAVVGELEFIKTRSDFMNPIMFQQIGSSLDSDASDIEYLEESMRKSTEVPKAQSTILRDDR